jgi:tRNA threonylcarbamoyladenosine modification (KEOPS) complex  Pcc1 subunit
MVRKVGHVHSSELAIPCGSAARARTALAALAPELGETVPKSKVSGRVVGETLIISVSSSDLAALRAATNSYIRWCDLALRALGAAEGTATREKEERPWPAKWR